MYFVRSNREMWFSCCWAVVVFKPSHSHSLSSLSAFVSYFCLVKIKYKNNKTVNKCLWSDPCSLCVSYNIEDSYFDILDNVSKISRDIKRKNILEHESRFWLMFLNFEGSNSYWAFVRQHLVLGEFFKWPKINKDSY